MKKEKKRKKGVRVIFDWVRKETKITLTPFSYFFLTDINTGDAAAQTADNLIGDGFREAR